MSNHDPYSDSVSVGQLSSASSCEGTLAALPDTSTRVPIDKLSDLFGPQKLFQAQFCFFVPECGQLCPSRQRTAR